MTEILLFSMDDSAPPEGFYTVRLRRGCVNRALGVICNDGLWQVFLDGTRIADPSLNWKEAFGRLFKMPFLKGAAISRTAYLLLVQARQTDALRGIDPDQPIDHSNTKVAI